MAALSAHPHLRRTTVDTPAGRISLPPPGPLFDGASRPCGAVPALGADTERVLAEFGRKSEVGSPLVPSPLAGEGSRSS
jgi:hypothetical protein